MTVTITLATDATIKSAAFRKYSVCHYLFNAYHSKFSANAWSFEQTYCRALNDNYESFRVPSLFRI